MRDDHGTNTRARAGATGDAHQQATVAESGLFEKIGSFCRVIHERTVMSHFLNIVRLPNTTATKEKSNG